MKKSKRKLCKIPRCCKEVYDNKSIFCGEHEREFKNFLKTSGKAVFSIGALAMAFIADKNLKKNN